MASTRLNFSSPERGGDWTLMYVIQKGSKNRHPFTFSRNMVPFPLPPPHIVTMIQFGFFHISLQPISPLPYKSRIHFLPPSLFSHPSDKPTPEKKQILLPAAPLRVRSPPGPKVLEHEYRTGRWGGEGGCIIYTMKGMWKKKAWGKRFYRVQIL